MYKIEKRKAKKRRRRRRRKRGEGEEEEERELKGKKEVKSSVEEDNIERRGESMRQHLQRRWVGTERGGGGGAGGERERERDEGVADRQPHRQREYRE